ncbi:MAG: hypothetical protein ACR2PZ_19710 [Pseudomonadales bacterium]
MQVLRSILAIVLGAVVGGAVNMGLIVMGPSVIAPPAGVDVSSSESLANAIHLFEPKHFLVPFLAHAIGTGVGALVAFVVAATRKSLHGLIVGVLFLCGGIVSSTMIPAPIWFVAADLVLAYLPMAWLGNRLGAKFS